MFWVLTILVLSFLILLDYLIKRRRIIVSKDIPGPNILPIIGNFALVSNQSIEGCMRIIEEGAKNYGPLTKGWAFNMLIVICFDPKDLEILLTSSQCIKKSTVYKVLNLWLRDGLLLSSDHKWHQRRKIITPTFHFKILEEFVDVFDRNSTILVKKLERVLNEGDFDVDPFIRTATLDVIAETAMSTKIYAQENPNSEYVRAVTEVTHIMTLRITNIMYHSSFLFQLLEPRYNRQLKKDLKILHEFTDRIIQERRESFLKENINMTGKDIDDIGIKRKSALLDILLQSTIDGKPLTNADIQEEVDTFMFEGHDTTTAGINFTLYCLSRHSTVQDKVFREIRDILGDDKNEPVDIRKLNDMKYLELVIKEALRLYPPVPLIGRITTEDVDLNGRIIPADVDVIVPIYLLHRSPEIFTDPLEFRPERHALESIDEKQNPFIYLPFSAGQRNCVGQKFAMLEMKSVISKIIRFYELLPMGPEPDVRISMIIRSENGIHLGIRTRKYL